jgi:hypothetical protein
MLSFNSDALKSPVYAGVMGAVFYLLASYVMNRFFSKSGQQPVQYPGQQPGQYPGQQPVQQPVQQPGAERLNVRQAVMTGCICAVVMYLAQRKNSGTMLTETFD